jgi:hypothetical protein
MVHGGSYSCYSTRRRTRLTNYEETCQWVNECPKKHDIFVYFYPPFRNHADCLTEHLVLKPAAAVISFRVTKHFGKRCIYHRFCVLFIVLYTGTHQHVKTDGSGCISYKWRLYLLAALFISIRPRAKKGCKCNGCISASCQKDKC